MRTTWISLVVAVGCHSSLTPFETGDPGTDVDPFFADPFADMADTSEGLTNASHDLEALLEHGELDGACERWEADPDDRRLELLCGKSMFFYEGFGTLGIPTAILDFGGSRFQAQMGEGYSKLGLIPDPYGPEGRALGFGEGAPIGDGVSTQAMTCAACHFGQLSDGRYAVGAPNLDYRYGTHMLALNLFPAYAAPGFDPAAHDPTALAQISPVLDAIDAQPALKTSLLLALLPLASAQDEVPAMDPAVEAQYASWEPGTMDFLIAPLPVDDDVHTISKISHLFGIPTPEEQAEAGMDTGLLAWTGGAESLRRFLAGFVRIGNGDEGTWTEERLEPLAAYIESLSPPEPPPVDGDVARGGAVFASACLDCHGAPRGSGTRVYGFQEVGTDSALGDWGAPDPDGTACCGLADAEDPPLTGGVKSPRLVGLWSMPRFLHNGSVESLEALFCLEDRAGIAEQPWSDVGHEFGCDLPVEDRQALLAYLRSH